MDGRFRNEETARRLGRNVFTARRRAGFSQEELGALASVHRTHVGFIEIGQRLPRADTLIKLASALAVGVEELVAGIEWIVPAPSRLGSFAIQRGGADAR
ncbi:MAG TPA: helix-turn-helix transcriptional regulator [Solirubrobacterales bacterium]|nr:helix-turn-helix transcriptional regulator [Solirubrobacterales bacterium]